MKADLVRFGVAMDPQLLGEIDALAATRGCTRSELLRDLARAEVGRSATRDRSPAVATVTLVYNHHVRELSERLTSIQHDLGEAVRSAMHVHLDHEHCIEVLVMRGRADELRAAADRMLATRGVTQGGMELVPESALAHAHAHRHGDDASRGPSVRAPAKAPARTPARRPATKTPVREPSKPRAR